MLDKTNIPKHVAIIMDGNGRWARKRGLSRFMGHRAGIESVKKVIKASIEIGIEILTLYVFSTENWRRPKKEIDSLMKLLYRYLGDSVDELNKNCIKLITIGDISGLPSFVQDRLREIIDITKNNSRMTLNLALNYGGRQEIINAVKRISSEIKKGEFDIDNLNEEKFSDYLYTMQLRDPDLLIRTSGEFRISNFLLWQISYAEIHITPKLWPDFRRKDLEIAIKDFQQRNRRFGGI